MRKRLAVALVLLAMTLSPAPTLACEEGPPPAAAVQPLHPTLVTLEALDVRVTVMADRSEVEAVFTLRNTGPATTVLMGFAEWQPEEGESCTGMHDLQVSVDGSEVSVKRDPDVVPEPNPLGQVAAWHTWEVDFDAGQTRRLGYTCWSHSAPSQGYRSTGYLLAPVGAWHGNVGRTRVVLELAQYRPYDISRASPLGHRFEGDDLVWEWQDSPLPHNIHLVFHGLLSLEKTLRAGGRSFVKQWDELDRSGNYDELLAQVKLHHDDEDLNLDPHLAPLYEARAQMGLGQTDDAVRNWRHILDLTMQPGTEYLIHPAQDEAYYHLARYYHEAGDEDQVRDIYQELKRRVLPPGGFLPFELLRWLESLLPPALTVGQPPVVQAVLRARKGPVYMGTSHGYSLEYQVEDPDGDFNRLGWAIWFPGDDPDHPSYTSYSLLGGPARESQGSLSVSGPGEPVWYQVDAVDLKGNRGSTGILEYVGPDELPEPGSELPGRPPGALKESGDEPPAALPRRKPPWTLIIGGVSAVGLAALLRARRRRARSL
ncbi:MAG: hypothetical protein RDU89_09245 [bacterium]|nr:hypothetical protein [bacterium]